MRTTLKSVVKATWLPILASTVWSLDLLFHEFLKMVLVVGIILLMIICTGLVGWLIWELLER